MTPRPTLLEKFVQECFAEWNPKFGEVTLHHFGKYVAQRVSVICQRVASNPYGDDVQVLGREEPLSVGEKIAKAIERLFQ